MQMKESENAQGKAHYFQNCPAATLEEVLAAREARAAKQQALLVRFFSPIICFKLNIPGEVKVYPLAVRAFGEGKSAVERQLARHSLGVLHSEEAHGVAGQEAFWTIQGEPRRIKALMIALEEGHTLGRLFDIDVLAEDGRAVEGAALGRQERGCLLCGKPVWACARSRAHPAQELALRAAEMMDLYFANGCADAVAEAALHALLCEVSVTPKPGLVDRANSGAHADMDFYSFLSSATVLGPYFREMALLGFRHLGEAEALLPCLRYAGQEAENAMLAATGGVNTHKGAIFSLGITAAAAGWLAGQGKEVRPENLFDTCGRIASGTRIELLPPEPEGSFPRGDTKIHPTHGETAFAAHGLEGIRGEAAAGFPSVAKCALPKLEALLAEGLSINDAGAITLLWLIAAVDDTNIVHRKGLAALRRIQRDVGALLRRESDPARLLAAAEELDVEFIRQSVSPGGCADLLALCFFAVAFCQKHGTGQCQEIYQNILGNGPHGNLGRPGDVVLALKYICPVSPLALCPE